MSGMPVKEASARAGVDERTGYKYNADFKRWSVSTPNREAIARVAANTLIAKTFAALEDLIEARHPGTVKEAARSFGILRGDSEDIRKPLDHATPDAVIIAGMVKLMTSPLGPRALGVIESMRKAGLLPEPEVIDVEAEVVEAHSKATTPTRAADRQGGAMNVGERSELSVSSLEESTPIGERSEHDTSPLEKLAHDKVGGTRPPHEQSSGLSIVPVDGEKIDLKNAPAAEKNQNVSRETSTPKSKNIRKFKPKRVSPSTQFPQ